MRRVPLLVFSTALFLSPHVAQAAYEISDGSVRALYHLEDTTDGSGNGYTLTNNNGATFVPGLLGKAATGGSPNVGSYLSLASDVGIGGGTVSISAWFKQTIAAPTNTQQWAVGLS